MTEAGKSPSDIGEEFGLDSKQVNYYLRNIIGERYTRYPLRLMLVEMGLTPQSGDWPERIERDD